LHEDEVSNEGISNQIRERITQTSWGDETITPRSSESRLAIAFFLDRLQVVLAVEAALEMQDQGHMSRPCSYLHP